MYLLDANVFIEAKNRYYGFDIVPAFWDWMDLVTAVNAVTITPVRDELLNGADELSDWMKARKNDVWILDVTDKSTQENFADIANELNGSPYKSAAVADFLSGADPWLVAKAVTTGATIVTHETFDMNCKRRVPLPNICPSRGIKFINTFEFMRILKAKFTLA